MTCTINEPNTTTHPHPPSGGGGSSSSSSPSSVFRRTGGPCVIVLHLLFFELNFYQRWFSFYSQTLLEFTFKLELFNYDCVIDVRKTKAITVRIDSLIFYHLGKDKFRWSLGCLFCVYLLPAKKLIKRKNLWLSLLHQIISQTLFFGLKAMIILCKNRWWIIFYVHFTKHFAHLIFSSSYA